VFVVEPVVKNKLEKLQLEAARIVTGSLNSFVFCSNYINISIELQK
jgi:hypothetical protein